jgi:hypothetical protein
VVLHLGDDDLVTRTDPETGRLLPRSSCVAHRIGDQVDALGGVLDEDDLVRPATDERSDPGPRRLVEVGGFLGQLVRATVYGGVVQRVVVALGVEDLDRLLRRGARVEIDEAVPVADRAGQDREVSPDPLDVQGRCDAQAAGGRHAAPAV